MYITEAMDLAGRAAEEATASWRKAKRSKDRAAIEAATKQCYAARDAYCIARIAALRRAT